MWSFKCGLTCLYMVQGGQHIGVAEFYWDVTSMERKCRWYLSQVKVEQYMQMAVWLRGTLAFSMKTLDTRQLPVLISLSYACAALYG